MLKMETFDITPHPRILQVLGEIEFSPSQCIAELVDNAIDGFLRCQREENPIAEPLVQVAVGNDTVVVKDNGPGMSPQELEMAVKAGWTSNEKFGNLGLYGIGFNVATARLGAQTTIWTSRAGESSWHGVTIDLPKMARGGTYKLEVLRREKAQTQVSGTEVEVRGLKNDWREQLNNSPWLRKNVTERLARVYGTMLRNHNPQPIHFALRVNDKSVSAWEHCVWSENRTVFRKGDGLVHAIRQIDQTFGTKYLSKSTGELHDVKAGLDPDDLIEVPERIYGWLGIQRYVHDTDYGLDVLRNGRKIEIGCKDLFQWEGPDGSIVPEYPIDEQRHRRGRIVGELHIDHGYVHFTKHRFEREHLSWKQLLLAVKNNEPLVNRDKLGFKGLNTSPLGGLYRAFRRNSPGTGQDYKNILIIKDNALAQRWAAELRKGNVWYHNDGIWYAEVEKSDVEETSPIPPPHDGPGTAPESPLDPGDAPSEKPDDDPTTKSEPVRSAMAELNLHVSNIGPSGKTYSVEVFRLEHAEAVQSLAPWRSKWTARGVFEIEVYPEHDAFKSTSLQVRDAVLAEVAYIITTEETASSPDSGVRFADVLAALRTRFSKAESLDHNALRLEIESARRQLASRVETLDVQKQKALLQLLPEEDIKEMELARARGPKGVPVSRYLAPRHFAAILERQPVLLFDAGCFTNSWSPDTLLETPLLEEYRARLANDIWLPMKELGDFADLDSADLSRTRLALARACVNRIRDFLPQ